jgi:hypothetical protein
MKTLHLGAGVRLPADLVTESLAILAIKGAGKSTTGRRLVEQIFHAGQQTVVVDPKGDWWGLLFGRDGETPGLPFIVLGGEHGHIPIAADAGALVARLAAVERASLVLDLSDFRKHEVTRFMTFFLEELYRLKAKAEFRTPVMLVIDEADAIAPQRPISTQGNLEPRMLGAAEDIVRRGRQRGIGCTLITQRAAVLNKNVLTQVSMLILLRTIANQDIEAVDAWVEKHGTAEQRDACIASLPSLANGEAWVWSPIVPAPAGIFKRVQIDLPETFDSSRTPRVGEKPIVPKHSADVDLAAFQREMAATIEKARAEDPTHLQRRIRELEAELRKAGQAKPAPPAPPEKVFIFTDADRALLGESLEMTGRAIQTTELMRAKLLDLVEAVVKRTNGHAPPAPAVGAVYDRRPVQTSAVGPTRPKAPPAAGPGDDSLSKAERALLTAFAQRASPSTRSQISILSGYSIRSSSFDKALSLLRGRGLVWGTADELGITPAGSAALGDFPAPPAGRELVAWWKGKVGKAAAALLDVVVAHYPHAVSKDILASESGYSITSSSFDKALSTLNTLELIAKAPDGIRASPNFF